MKIYFCFYIQQEKFIVVENYQAQSSEEMTVCKNDVVFFISKHKKDPQLYNVRSFSRERSGYVPVTILKKLSAEGEEVRKSKFEGELLVSVCNCFWLGPISYTSLTSSHNVIVNIMIPLLM